MLKKNVIKIKGYMRLKKVMNDVKKVYECMRCIDKNE